MFSSPAHHSPHQASAPTPTPPTKANLKAWWNHFNFVQKTKKETFEGPYRPYDSADHPVFGKPLKESLRYASVQISTADANGELYVWGYIPVVVAKCGLYLKENATEVQGTFRVNGSNKRMRDLQAAFEAPPRYGKSLDWKNESYTTHDVASVFRRYLTQMPEPVIPYDMYHPFRDALAKQPFNQEEVIATFKSFIRRMPRSNQYLLLYVLDLLSVFARKSDKNLMTATNLAVIFRPGILAHPEHEMSPKEHALGQKVLEFLIAHQDWFMLDIIPPAPPGGFPGDDREDAGQGGAAGGGGAGGSSGAGPSSRGAGPPAGGTTGKWREGMSTPTRQGTMDSSWTGNMEAGPSTGRPTTTRQRVISGGPDVGAWHAYGRRSPSGYAHGTYNPSTPQRNNSKQYNPAHSQSTPLSSPTIREQQPRHTPHASEQSTNSYFNGKHSSPHSNYTQPNISANIPDGQRLHVNQQEGSAEGSSVFATPMSSIPPSPAEISASGHAGGSMSGHGQGQRPGVHPAQQDSYQQHTLRQPQVGEQQSQQTYPLKPSPSSRKASSAAYPILQQSQQTSANTRDFGAAPIHAKFAHTDPYSAAFINPPALIPSSQTQPLPVSPQQPYQQPSKPAYMLSASSPQPSTPVEPSPGLAYALVPPLGSGASDVDDVMVISEGEEEESYVGEGGWKLVPKGYATLPPPPGATRKDRTKDREQALTKEERDRIRALRRRTAMDRSELYAAPFGYDDPKGYGRNGISPILESDTIIHADSAIGLVRSRTLPARRRNGDSRLDDKENAKGDPPYPSPDNTGYPRPMDVSPRTADKGRDKRVLKKQRRVSSDHRS